MYFEEKVGFRNIEIRKRVLLGRMNNIIKLYGYIVYVELGAYMWGKVNCFFGNMNVGRGKLG